MLNGVTFMKDAMSGQTVGSAAKIIYTCVVMSGVKNRVNYAAENPFCFQDKKNAE